MKKESIFGSAKTSRQFISIAYDRLSEGDKSPPSFASLARKANFSSRAHVREIILGKKLLTGESLAGIAKALELNSKEARLLKFLIEYEKPENSHDEKKKSTLLKKIEISKDRLEWTQKRIVESIIPEESFLHDNEWSRIYAALGSEETPEQLDRIVALTKISRAKVEKILSKMVSENVCTNIDNRQYYANHSHLLAEKLQDYRLGMRLFNHSLGQTQKQANEDFKNPLNLFQATSFKIKKSEAAKLRERLIVFLDEFISEADRVDGDEIASIVVGFS